MFMTRIIVDQNPDYKPLVGVLPDPPVVARVGRRPYRLAESVDADQRRTTEVVSVAPLVLVSSPPLLTAEAGVAGHEAWIGKSRLLSLDF
jgi:hypothetical protein